MNLRDNAVTIARRALQAVPDSLLSRVLPGRLAWDNEAMQVAHAPDARVRLLVAPMNSAGQGYRWARAAEQNLIDVGAVSMMLTNPARDRYSFPVDVSVPESGFVFASRWQRRQRQVIIDDFSHVLLESGQYPFGSLPGRTPLQAVDELTREGKSVALLWHGSDIRVPSLHVEEEPDSPFGQRGGYPQASTAVLETNARARLRMVTETDLPVFVSTPGLLNVPRARWLPVVVDIERWGSDAAPLQQQVPTVAYVPSNSPMKGDPSIDVQLAGLESEGLIRYRRLENIPSRDMPKIYRSADIVLDQFRLGDYGVAACEALAAGRVVIGHVNERNRARVKETTGLELPIVEARFSDVAATVRRVVEDREAFAEHAAKGTSFARAVHSGAASAAALAEFLGTEVRER
ncbi:hypothetical protein [Microbacterium sp.]|uniref:hypothetical protein n=1 Tax=Microbacterium sp. TaxID=51671 RepID=UPI00261BC48A|nr:hypothetical protein [Microbacterium sp.]